MVQVADEVVETDRRRRFEGHRQCSGAFVADVNAGRCLEICDEARVAGRRLEREPAQLVLAVGELGDRREHAGGHVAGALARGGVDQGDPAALLAQPPSDGETDGTGADHCHVGTNRLA